MIIPGEENIFILRGIILRDGVESVLICVATLFGQRGALSKEGPWQEWLNV